MGTLQHPDRQISRRRSILLVAGLAAGAGAAFGLSACAPPASAPQATTPAPASTTAAAPAAPAAATAAPKAAPTAAPKVLEQTTLRVAAVRGLYENVYAMLGVEKGIYAKYGLTNVEFIELPGGKQQVDAVLAGEADWCETGLAAPFASIEQGSGLRLFAAPRPKINFIMIGAKDINQPTDLYGRTIGTAALGSQLHTLALAYLDRHGIDPERVNFVNIGSSPDVARAVFTQKVDAGPVTNEWEFQLAGQPDVKVIANLSEELPNFLRVAVFARNDMLDTKPEFMTAAMMGYSESLRYALEHRDETLELSMKLTGNDRTSTEQIFDLYLRDQQVNANLDFSTEQIDYMQNLHLKLGVQQAVMPLDKVIDTRYFKAVEEKLGRYTPKS